MESKHIIKAKAEVCEGLPAKRPVYDSMEDYVRGEYRWRDEDILDKIATGEYSEEAYYAMYINHNKEAEAFNAILETVYDHILTVTVMTMRNRRRNAE